MTSLKDTSVDIDALCKGVANLSLDKSTHGDEPVSLRPPASQNAPCCPPQLASASPAPLLALVQGSHTTCSGTSSRARSLDLLSCSSRIQRNTGPPTGACRHPIRPARRNLKPTLALVRDATHPYTSNPSSRHRSLSRLPSTSSLCSTLSDDSTSSASDSSLDSPLATPPLLQIDLPCPTRLRTCTRALGSSSSLLLSASAVRALIPS